MLLNIKKIIKEEKYCEFNEVLEKILYRDISIKDSVQTLLYLKELNTELNKELFKKYIESYFGITHYDKILNLHIDEELDKLFNY